MLVFSADGRVDKQLSLSAIFQVIAERFNMSEVFFTFISNDFVLAPSVRFEADCVLIRKCKYLYRTVHGDAFVITAIENTSKYLC